MKAGQRSLAPALALPHHELALLVMTKERAAMVEPKCSDERLR